MGPRTSRLLSPAPRFGNVPHRWALHIVKHKAKMIFKGCIVMGKGTYKYTAKKSSQFFTLETRSYLSNLPRLWRPSSWPISPMTGYLNCSKVQKDRAFSYAYWQLSFWVLNFSWFGKLLVFLVQNVVFSGKTTTLFLETKNWKINNGT
jgi:hypothetical protein